MIYASDYRDVSARPRAVPTSRWSWIGPYSAVAAVVWLLYRIAGAWSITSVIAACVGLITLGACVIGWRRGMTTLVVLVGFAVPYGLAPVVALADYRERARATAPYLPVDRIDERQLLIYIAGGLMALSAYLVFGRRQRWTAARVLAPSRSTLRLGVIGYWTLAISVELVLLVTLVRNYDSFSYASTVAGSVGTIAANALQAAPLIVMSLVWFGRRTEGADRLIAGVLASLLVLTTIAIVIRSGNRGPLLALAVGLAVLIAFSGGSGRRSFRGRRLGAVVLLLIGAGLLTNVRADRGDRAGAIGLETLNVVEPLAEMSLEDVVFQDWLTPGMTVGLTQADHLVLPSEIVGTSIRNLPVVSEVVGSSSSGALLARRYDPRPNTGYGDYFLRDGWTLAGPAGLVPVVMWITGCAVILDRVAMRIGADRILLTALVAASSTSIVRSQAVSIVRISVLYILPIAILTTVVAHAHIRARHASS